MIRKIGKIIKEMITIFINKKVTRSAAELSYYLTLSVFPLLLIVSFVLGSTILFDLETAARLYEILPDAAFTIFEDFFSHIETNRSNVMLIVGVIAMITTSSAVIRSFNGIVEEIQGKSAFKGIWKMVFSFIFSIAFLGAIYFSGFIILTGNWLLQDIGADDFFPNLISAWTWLRFVILYLIMFVIIFLLYLSSNPKGISWRSCLPGAFAAPILLVLVGIIHSHLISVSVRFELVYGSLASFMLLMVWLYLFGVILIMGNVLNFSIRKHNQKHFADEKQENV